MASAQECRALKMVDGWWLFWFTEGSFFLWTNLMIPGRGGDDTSRFLGRVCFYWRNYFYILVVGIGVYRLVEGRVGSRFGRGEGNRLEIGGSRCCAT